MAFGSGWLKNKNRTFENLGPAVNFINVDPVMHFIKPDPVMYFIKPDPVMHFIKPNPYPQLWVDALLRKPISKCKFLRMTDIIG